MKPKNHLRYFLPYLWFCFSMILQGVNGQEYYCYDQLTTSKGLSQSTVNCFLIDKDGFMWIGTQDGLNMYDGFSFTAYFNQPSDTTSLSNNYVLSLCEDKEGYIWAGTMGGGLNKLDKHTDKFIVYQSRKNDTSWIIDNTIWSLEVDNSNNILIGTSKGLNVLENKTGRFKHYHHIDNDDKTIPSNMITSIFVSDNNEIWCGTTNGLARYVEQNDNFNRIKGFNTLKNKNPVIWVIAQGTSGNLLLGTNTGLWEYSPEKGTYNELYCHQQATSKIWSLLTFDEKTWMGTRTGLQIFNDQNKICTHISIPVSGKNQSFGNMWCLMKDNAGIIWAGTDNGILKFKSLEGRFNSLGSNLGDTPHLSEKSVNSILIDKDKTLWVGTDGGGLNRLDENSSQFTVFTKNELDQNSIPGNRVWSLIEDVDGLIWIGTYGAGLSSFNKKIRKFRNYQKKRGDPHALSNNRVMALFEDTEGDIWIGTRGGGLNMFDKKTGLFDVYLHNPDDSTSISSNTVLSIAEDARGNILVGTFEGGLSIFDKQNKVFHTIRNNPDIPNSLSSNSVWSILYDSKKRLWLGTQGGLVLAQNPDSSLTFYHFGTGQGLPGNVIFGIEEDNIGNLWLSTFKGIAKLNNDVLQELINKDEDLDAYANNPFKPLFKNYAENDGLAGVEFNQGAYFKSMDGAIYFGSLSGLTYFYPDSIIKSTFEPRIILSDFKIFNKEVHISPSRFSKKTNEILKIDDRYYLPDKISYLNELTLTYRESVFSFSFSSLDYTFPDQNHYAYKMENFDKDWNYVANYNSATYTNLDAGNYVFRVKGTNSDGKWSPHEVKLKITIVPPFWDTIWFKVIVTAVLLLIIILIINRIFQAQKRKALAEKEKMELQLKTIKNQIDPHFAFNAINMIGSLVYKGNPDMVYDYFSRFARLIRSTLEDSEKISRPLKEELDFVKNYVEIQKARFKDKFDFVLNINEGTDLSIEVPKMIIQTHAENAIKHGLMHKKEKGELAIQIKQEGRELRITINDNGIGREKAKLVSKGSTGKGMQIIEQIFSLYNKLTTHSIHQQIIDLKDETGNAIGTEVILIVQLN